MNNKFDELTKSMAQSLTRRGALKKLGVGLGGMVLACFGLANRAEAAKHCVTIADCGGVGACVNGLCITPCDSCVSVCTNFNGRSRSWCTRVYCADVCT